MLPEEQLNQIKEQLISQIDSTNLPNKEEIKSQINSMNAEQLEEFLVKNNLINGQNQQQKCVFCSIVSGEMQSYKIEEDTESIAVLEINPISKGHLLIIPREHLESSEKISKEIFSFAKKISKRIKSKLKPKKIETYTSNVFGHEIINILPIYENETINSERYKAKKEDLEELQKKLLKKPRKKIIREPKIKKISSSEKLWLPRRIP